MAKTIQYKIDFNTSKAEQELDGIDKQLDDIQEKSKVDLLIETSQSVRSVGDVRKAYKDLRDAQIEVGEGTEEFTRLGTAAAGLKDKLDAVNEVARDLGGSTFEKLSNSLGRIKEGIVNLDLDKVKQGFGQLVTTFGALTQGLTKGQIAVRAFTTALVASGVGAFIVAVGLLVSQFDKLKNAGGAIGGIFKGVNEIFEGFKEGILGLADTLGLVDKRAADSAISRKKIRDDEKAAIDKDLAEIEALREKYRQDDLNNRQKAFEALAKRRADEFKILEADIKKENLAQLGQYAEIEFRKADFNEQTRIKQQQLTDKFAAEDAAKRSAVALESQKLVDDKFRKELDTLIKNQAEKNIIQEKETQLAINALDLTLADELKKVGGNLAEKAKLYIKYYQDKERLELEKNNISPPEIASLKGVDDILARYKGKISLTEEEIANIRKEYALNAFLAVDKQELNKLEITKKYANLRTQVVIDEINRSKTLDEKEKEAEEKKLKNIEDISKVIETFANTEIETLQMQIALYDQKIAQLESQNIREGDLYQALVDKKVDAEFRLRDAVIATEEEKKAARMEAIQTGLSAASNFTNALTSLSDSIFANELANAKGNAVEEEKIRKKAFEANKALGITNAVISTAQAVISAFNAGASMGPAGVVMGPVMAALAGVTGAIQIAAIANAQYSPTGGGATPTTTTVPSPSVPSSVTPSVSFAGEGTTGFNQVGGGSNQFNMSASISVSEINNTQNQVAIYETGSIIGGFG